MRRTLFLSGIALLLVAGSGYALSRMHARGYS
jgi:hypothetical protein